MSNTDFIVYKINKNDSLESISRRLQIHPVDLKFFHNTRCSTTDRIVFDNFNGIQQLFVPIDYNDKSNRIKEKSFERPSDNFNEKFYKKECQITEIIIDQLSNKQIVSYNFSLEFLKNTDKNILKLTRDNFKNNGKTPDNKLYHLAQKVEQNISPFQFSIHENGTPSGLFELDQIIENFRQKRVEILEDFIGDVTENYLDTIDYNLTNEEYLLKQFSSSLLFQTLFPNLKVFQTDSVFQKKFYTVPNSIEVNFKCEALYNHQHPQVVETLINGISLDNCALDEVINGIKSDDENENTSFYATVFFYYKTDKITKQLIEASSEIKLIDNEKEFRTYKLIIK